jgi:flagellar hook-associated protein 3 FlgL
MRVTNNMLVDNFMKNLYGNLRKMDNIQNKMASGKKIRVPSDDPIGTAHSLRLRSDLEQLEQYSKNVDDAISWLNTTESALKNVGDILQRIRELTLYGANDSLTQDERDKILSEVTQLKGQIVQEANSSYAGRFIFAGTLTDAPPFDPVNPTVYNGNLGNIMYEYSPLNTIKVNVTGEEAFRVPNDLFQVLSDLENDLQTGNTANLSGVRLQEIDDGLANILKVRAEVGAKINRFETVKASIEEEKINFTNLLSQTEDVDMAQIIMDLKMQENVYRASLATGARVIQPTLLDFLR